MPVGSSYGAPSTPGYGGPPPSSGHPGYGGAPAPTGSSYGTGAAGGAGASASGGNTISVEVHADGLRDRDVLSGSDPMAVLFVWSTAVPYGSPGSVKSDWVEVGRTERVANNHSPRFTTRIAVPFQFETVQRLRVRLVDVDDRKSARLVDQDDLGEAFGTVGDLVSTRVLQLPLKPTAGLAGVAAKLGAKKNWGTVSLLAHAGGGNQGKLRVRLTPSATNLDKKDGPFGKSDPYLLIHRVVRPAVGGSEAVLSQVFKSLVIRKELNPSWPACSFTTEQTGLGDLRMEVWDHDDRSQDDIIGAASMTLHELSSPGSKSCPLLHPAKVAKATAKKPAKPSGHLHLANTSVEAVPTLTQYLFGGLELHFSVAIDFTASNGDPSSTQSLHHDSPAAPSAYVNALTSVGAVLEPYSRSRRYEAIGFGGQLPTGRISHNFALTGGADPVVDGVDGIVAAYRNALGGIKLAGPTNFADVIGHASAAAAGLPVTPTAQGYLVLLILTDGVITDMAQTKAAIAAAAAVPLSIIIVGVGTADFSRMHELDGDEPAGSVAAGRGPGGARRDLVQFVPMNKFGSSPPALAAAVLAELPAQVVDYYAGRGVSPMRGA